MRPSVFVCFCVFTSARTTPSRHALPPPSREWPVKPKSERPAPRTATIESFKTTLQKPREQNHHEMVEGEGGKIVSLVLAALHENRRGKAFKLVKDEVCEGRGAGCQRLAKSRCEPSATHCLRQARSGKRERERRVNPTRRSLPNDLEAVRYRIAFVAEFVNTSDAPPHPPSKWLVNSSWGIHQ